MTIPIQPYIHGMVGKRCLLKVKNARFHLDVDVSEYRVLEASPSGNWVRLQNANGNKFWRVVSDVAFVEELLDIRVTKPPAVDPIGDSALKTAESRYVVRRRGALGMSDAEWEEHVRCLGSQGSQPVPD